MSTASSELVDVPKHESKLSKNEEDNGQKDTMELKKDLMLSKEPENGVVDQLKSVNGIPEEKMEIDENSDPAPKQNGTAEPTDDDEDEEDDDTESKLLIDTESTDSTSVTNEDELLNTDEEIDKVVENGIDHSKLNANDIKSEESSQNEKENIKREEIKTKNKSKSNETKDVKMEDVFKEASINEKKECNITESKKDIKPEQLQEDSCTENEEESKKQRLELQMKRVEMLKEDLLREEATLALFRKLFDSQRGKNGFKSKPVPVPAPATIHPKPTPQPTPKQTASAKAVNAPPSKPPHNGNQPAQKFYIQVGNQLVPAPPPSSNTLYQYNGTTPSSNTSSRESQQKPTLPSQPPAPPKQTPEQKKNAAKAALRRQLEQTLLQIPPPRPPPADWNAIPNVNSIDFMMLVGLDEVVDTILAFDNKPTLKNALEELRPFNPRICAQCKIDFSPCWKAAKGSCIDEYVLCENCSLQNVKKELKAEHTSRLKSAFMKALKQEQKIEEKIKAGEEVDIPNVPGIDKNESRSHSPKVSQNRNSSPKLSSQSRSSSNHAPSPPERTTERHHQSNGNHHGHGRHQVVQHYPHHSLVQQLHHQHIQQQQIELEPTSRHSSRWHPYSSSSSSHHREHHPVHHRNYVQGSSSEGSPRQEYYVVHHPHHYVAR